MAENENGEEKTEQPTAKRLREARKKGQVAKSQDIVSAAFILGVFGIMRAFANLSYKALTESMEYWLTLSGKGMTDNDIIDGDVFYKTLILKILKTVIIACGPVMLVSILITVIATGVQTKFLFSKEALKPKFNMLNPINGLKKMFSQKALFELAKSLVKFVIIGVVLFGEFKSRIGEFARTFDYDPAVSVVYIAQSVFDVVITVTVVFVVIAAVDMFYQKYSFNNDMKMTKQEVKEEFKNTEGDPKIKGKRRQRQMELHNLMMQDVKSADVVVRNPTHYAVAIKYDPENYSAPVITAKGADRAALRIIKIAEENNVILVENRPLARALYERTEVDMEIPYEFYREVSEVLAFVYDLQKREPPIPKKKTQY